VHTVQQYPAISEREKSIDIRLPTKGYIQGGPKKIAQS